MIRPGTRKTYDFKKINFTQDEYEIDEFYSCAVKFRHTNYWSALQHFKSLRRILPAAKPGIYQCGFCDGLHLTSGRIHKDYFRLKETLKRLEQARAVPGYVTGAPKEVQARQAQLVIDLRARISELESEYQAKHPEESTLDKGKSYPLSVGS